jgi:hypothetical protein
LVVRRWIGVERRALARSGPRPCAVDTPDQGQITPSNAVAKVPTSIPTTVRGAVIECRRCLRKLV